MKLSKPFSKLPIPRVIERVCDAIFFSIIELYGGVSNIPQTVNTYSTQLDWQNFGAFMNTA